MRATKIIAITIAVLSLGACQWDSPMVKQSHDVNLDTLAYRYDTLKKRASDCGDKADSTCTVASAIYPLFKTDSVLNDTITARLIALKIDNPDVTPPRELKQLIDGFIANYETDKKAGNVYGRFYTLDAKAQVIRQDSSLTTLQLDSYTYTGGAHGNSFTSFVNWDTKNRKSLSLTDLVNETAKLTKVADTIFRREEKLAMNASLKNNYFFKDDAFALPHNFMITPVGLKFVYNQYEIKPYAAGQTELDIPYSKIKTLLRPNTVVTQYLK